MLNDKINRILLTAGIIPDLYIVWEDGAFLSWGACLTLPVSTIVGVFWYCGWPTKWADTPESN